MSEYQILPPLSQREYQALRRDIQNRGVQIPIILDEEGNVLDGHHRLAVCRELGITDYPSKILKAETEDQKIAVAIALNIARRHLTVEQIDELQDRLKSKKGLQKETAIQLRLAGLSQKQVAQIIGVDRTVISDWENVSNVGNHITNIPDLRVSIPKDQYPLIYHRTQNGEIQESIAADYHVHRSRISQIVRLVAAREHEYPEESPDLPEKIYKCIVIDPPWRMPKIEREERPNQSNKLEYSGMHFDEIKGLPVPELADEGGCHLYLWVTQKYLPKGFELVRAWGFKYQCLLTWVKPTGITPYSWMYNTEHVIFAKRGSLPLEENGIKLSFSAPVIAHSVKPDLFYEIVRVASPEPRLDMFGRREIKGFDSWGTEAPEAQDVVSA